MPKIVVHYDYGGLPLCDTGHRSPKLSGREEEVSCAKCLHRFNSGEDRSTSLPGSCAGGGREIELVLLTDSNDTPRNRGRERG